MALPPKRHVLLMSLLGAACRAIFLPCTVVRETAIQMNLMHPTIQGYETVLQCLACMRRATHAAVCLLQHPGWFAHCRHDTLPVHEDSNQGALRNSCLCRSPFV